MAKELEIVEGPHVLFVGANGKKTAGITVRHTGGPEVEARGWQREYNINTILFKLGVHEYQDMLGLSEDQVDTILEALDNIEA